jgi:hypothetical protein
MDLLICNIIYRNAPQDISEAELTKYKRFIKLLQSDNYNYNSAVILDTPTEYSDSAQDNIINIISQHDVLIITGKCLLKLDNIPSNVKMINITTCINYIHPLNNLPTELEHLIIDAGYYNNTLDLLPINLKSLLLYGFSDIPLNNLPSGLLELLVSGRYNEPLENLPRSLKILILSEFYQHKLINLPPGLKELYIGSDYYLPIEHLPDCIEDLTIACHSASIDKLPSNLKILNITYEANYDVKLVDSIEEIKVSSLALNLLYNLLDIYVPLSLKKITIDPLINELYADSISILEDGEMDKLEELRYNYPSIDIQFTNNYYDDT